ncbi:MAG: type II-A CRISPR-associated protein Csn2 [Bacteroides sp.]|nr:type II-A CRISPR-associated protein Csn2 [Bacteroides sp.]
MIIKKGCINILATNSPEVFNDFIKGFKAQKNNLLFINDNNQEVEIKKGFDFLGDPILSENISKRYIPIIIKEYIKNLDEENRNNIINQFIKLENLIQDSLLFEDVPLEISPKQDIKKLLKIEDLHLNNDYLRDSFRIIQTVINIHQNYDLETIPIFCNAMNYLQKNEINELSNLVVEMNQAIILIEFSDMYFKYFPKNTTVYYIDEDFLDYY